VPDDLTPDEPTVTFRPPEYLGASEPPLDVETREVLRDPGEKLVSFYAYEELGTTPTRTWVPGREAADRLLAARDRYRQVDFEAFARHEGHGYTSLDVLPEALGLPFDDLVVALLWSLRPSTLAVLGPGDGQITNAVPWRVTVRLDEDGRVANVSQEVAVGFGTGSDVMAALRRASLESTARRLAGWKRDSVPPPLDPDDDWSDPSWYR
jgi:hypothetical protein